MRTTLSSSRVLARTALFAATAAATVLAGCSSASSDAGSESDPLRIHPVDNENWSHLTLQLPTGSCQPGGNCLTPLGVAANITVDGAAVALGANTRLKPGDHVVSVNGLGWKVTMTPGQVRTAVLPIAHRKCVAAPLPNVPATDFGGTFTPVNAPCPTSLQTTDNTNNPALGGLTLYASPNCAVGTQVVTINASTNCSTLPSTNIVSASQGGTCSNWSTWTPAVVCGHYVANDGWTGFPAQGGAGTAPLADTNEAYVPGPMAVSVNGATQTFTLAEGDTQELTISLPALGTVGTTFSTDIAFGDSRDLPDAAKGTITSSCSGDRSYTIASSSTTALALSAFKNASCTYTLNVGGRASTLDQTQTNSFTLHRLDVDDVTITREDGSTYTVKGTYQLYFGGVGVAGPYATGTGVDVLPGTYDFALSYTDADGPKTQNQTLTF